MDPDDVRRQLSTITKITSGGQTGVDRAAEDGRIPDRYPLQEVSGGYRVRTGKNVVDSHATFILIADKLAAGTLLTRNLCRKHGKPHLVVKLTSADTVEKARQWLRETKIAVLNVAGPRESGEPGIHENTIGYLRTVFSGRALMTSG